MDVQRGKVHKVESRYSQLQGPVPASQLTCAGESIN